MVAIPDSSKLVVQHSRDRFVRKQIMPKAEGGAEPVPKHFVTSALPQKVPYPVRANTDVSTASCIDGGSRVKISIFMVLLLNA